jgi:site-specific recombinase XerD
VLLTDEGNPVDRDTLASWIKRVERRPGLPDKGRIHILRHTFCSRLAACGAPTMAIKELAGHSSIVTTQRYMHLSPSDRDRAIRLLEQQAGTATEPPGRGTNVAHGTDGERKA